MATGKTGIPVSSMAMAINTPIKTKTQGSWPFITPSVISFISIACGAESSVVPKPQALSRSNNTPPIVIAETLAPIISPICCRIGVAPRI